MSINDLGLLPGFIPGIMYFSLERSIRTAKVMGSSLSFLDVRDRARLVGEVKSSHMSHHPSSFIGGAANLSLRVLKGCWWRSNSLSSIEGVRDPGDRGVPELP